ncbi:MAG: PKHD-type hydroxylase, partial [Parvularculaceae bacterium]|nr:PKHD-type hydroxylase [Parvularculaceae bacterium]
MAALTISNVLGSDTLDAVLDLTRDLTWRDGKVTAGGQAKRVKENEQADLSATTGPAIKKLIAEKLRAHAVISAAARPQRFGPLMISRTQDGGFYGPHVDNALMK